MQSGPGAARRAGRGFAIGELLIALLLLAVTVSSLSALMYSVSRRSTSGKEPECVAAAAYSRKCAPGMPEGGGRSRLLRSGCATRSDFAQLDCADTTVSSGGPANSGEPVVNPRAD